MKRNQCIFSVAFLYVYFQVSFFIYKSVLSIVAMCTEWSDGQRAYFCTLKFCGTLDNVSHC